MKKLSVFLLVAALVAVMFTGCGAANGSVADKGYGADMMVQQESAGSLSDGMESGGTTTPANENQKLVRKIWLDAETEDMDTLLSGIDGRVGELGGYVEVRDVYNGSQSSTSRYRNADLTIRIPADKLHEFVEHVTENTNIISSNETADDITLTYTATESRMKALETEQSRLLELLAKAETMSDLLEIEARLTDVRTELEEVTSQLRLYDNQVSYGTIYLSISEVKEYTDTTEPETVWQRIGKGFMESMKNLGSFFTELFVFIVVGLPYIVLVGAVLAVVIILLKLRGKKKKAAKESE